MSCTSYMSKKRTNVGGRKINTKLSSPVTAISQGIIVISNDAPCTVSKQIHLKGTHMLSFVGGGGSVPKLLKII